MLVDKVGGGSVNTTHLVSFQVKLEDSVFSNKQVVVLLCKSRKLNIENISIDAVFVQKKNNPPFLFPAYTYTLDEHFFKRSYFLARLYLRKCNFLDQTEIPIFKGWKLRTRATNRNFVIHKTVETYQCESYRLCNNSIILAISPEFGNNC